MIKYTVPEGQDALLAFLLDAITHYIHDQTMTNVVIEKLIHVLVNV